MSADALLSRLDRVHRRGLGRWISRCPGHDDRSPSLSIRETDDQRVLVHCFAGCSIEQVLRAVGLELDVLFPDKAISDYVKRERRPFNAHDVLACIEFEVLIAATAASNMAAGWPLSDLDRARLLVVSERLQHAVEMANGG